MINTTRNDEEARQTEIRPEDNQCGNTARSRRLGEPESGSSQPGNDSHGTDHPIIQSEKSTGFTGVSRGEISGGMLSQLILETQEELAFLEQKLPRLRARLSSFQQLYQDLQRKTKEDLDDEEEVSEEEDDISERIDDASDEKE